MYVYNLPAKLVFVIKVSCVFCEVQDEAEETVEHQASVMIDCKTVARCGENFQCLLFIEPCIIVIVEDKRQRLYQMHTTTYHNLMLMLNPPFFTEHTTNVVIQQNSRKLLTMDILMSETC